MLNIKWVPQAKKTARAREIEAIQKAAKEKESEALTTKLTQATELLANID